MGVFLYFPNVIFTFSHQMAGTDCPLIGTYSPPYYITSVTRDHSLT